MPSHSLHFLTLRTSCWNCRKTILGIRRTCPHCGKATTRGGKRITWLYLLFLLIAVSFLAFSLWKDRF